MKHLLVHFVATKQTRMEGSGHPAALTPFALWWQTHRQLQEWSVANSRGSFATLARGKSVLRCTPASCPDSMCTTDTPSRRNLRANSHTKPIMNVVEMQ